MSGCCRYRRVFLGFGFFWIFPLSLLYSVYFSSDLELASVFFSSIEYVMSQKNIKNQNV